MRYTDRFLGGRGIATKIYWEEVPSHVGAFDPGNHLILMSGPLGATGVQGVSRFVAAGKSPMLLPEGFCFGNLMLKVRNLAILFSGTKSPPELASRFAGLRSGSGGRKGTFILPIVALSTKVGNREDNEE